MPNVSFAGLDETFDMQVNYVTFTGGVGFVRTSNNYSWLVQTTGHDVDFDGTGLSYSGTTPSGGTVTQFRFDLANDAEANPELRITGLSLSFALLAPLTAGTLTADQENNLIWRTVLSGNDTIDFGAGGYVENFAGDGRNIAGSVFMAGNDVMSGRISNTGRVTGDVLDIAADAAVIGGNDTMSIYAAISGYVYGDSLDVYGALIGGNDVLSVSAGGVLDNIRGDSRTIYNGGFVRGGSDTITLSGTTSGVGDSLTVATGGVLIGGNDTIYGSSGANTIVGDAEYADGSALGGSDTLYGNGGADNIFGDFYSVTGNVAGGNDWLFGGDGADNLYGNGGDDQLRGDAGADNLDGGEGFDTASWQYGTGSNINVASGTATDGEGWTDDIANIEQYVGSAYYRDTFIGAGGVQFFAGLGGNDYVIAGDAGADVYNGGDGFDTISYYNAAAGVVMEMSLNTATTGGETDTVVGFEEVYGSNNGADTIVGDAGDNTFYGFAGSDILVGGRGLDTYNGGLGNDTFGFNLADLQSGIWDVIQDFHEAVGDRDILYFNGVAQSSLIMGEANGGLYVSTLALAGNGGVFLVGFTAAQLSDQLLFS